MPNRVLRLGKNTCRLRTTLAAISGRSVELVTIVSLLLVLAGCAGFSSGGNNSSTSSQGLTISGVLPAGTVGSSYNGTITVSGGTAPYHFSISSGSLPPGLSLGAATGTISGTPTQAGTFAFTLAVTASSSLSGTQQFQITVANATPISVSVTPQTASVASGGTQQFSATVSNTSNTAVTWSANVGTISSGGLYQAPTVSSTTNAIVKATSVANPSAFGTASVTITANSSSPLSITTTSLPSATEGTGYSYTLSATGGTTPYSWTVVSGSLPSSITLQASGLLSGTPSEAGQFTFTVQVSDSSSPPETASQQFTLTVSTSSGGGNAPLAAFFGFTENSTNPGNWPTVSYGLQRFWDSPPDQWPSINTASGVFDFTNLDSDLALAYSNGVMEGMYTLARTPPWASSNPTDTTCAYTTAGSGGGDGECDPPDDLNADGSGTNATWKAWITAIATHVNSPGYTASHAHIKYWEIWNEPDTEPDASNRFWAGTFAQLARLTEDANCIITRRGVIHENGNGTATPCAATAIDPTAKIVMASGHAKGVALTFAQNQLYCNNTSKVPGEELPCPNPPNAIAAAVDIVNFHMKPGNESGDNCPAPTPCTPESAMQWYVSNVQSILEAAEKAKPLWNGEAAYSDQGFIAPYTDPDMAASFMPRYYLINWTLGVSGMAWYTWDDLNAAGSSVQTSYQQTYNWLANASLTTPCSATGTVWSCGITQNGTPYLIMWDTSQSCANGSCTTSNQTVGAQWTTYQDMTMVSTPATISEHVVPVGIKPVVLK